METTTINFDMATPASEFEIPEGQELYYVQNGDVDFTEPICGKLEFLRQEGNRKFHKVVANGCVWVYLTDCGDKIEAGHSYNCVVGNQLYVDGCHAFGCNC